MNNTILVAGAGGFIGGALASDLIDQGYVVRAVDKKPLREWCRPYKHANLENICLDLSDEQSCRRAVETVAVVYNLAADMGGMGFIERFRVECMRSVLINTHLIEAACNAGVRHYFYASSACAYNTDLQQRTDCVALKEEDAYPANAERGYGWEKLFSELMCQEYAAERGMNTAIARFHNVYGPYGTWHGGREKAPAAICRKVIEAKRSGSGVIEIWGDGNQTRSFMYIDDCVKGIQDITWCPNLIAVPINLGSAEMISINELVSIAEDIAGVKLERCYDLIAPKGVAGRSSDNTMIKRVLDWEPGISIRDGLQVTYDWIEKEIEENS